MSEGFVALIWIGLAVLVVFVWSRAKRRGRRMGGVGTAGAAMVYDMLNEEKRNAVEIILEEKAAARDPEDRDGNLPELENPTSRSR